MKKFKINDVKEYSLFFWLILLAIFGLIVLSIYSENNLKKEQKIESSLDNTYLKKTIKELTNYLKPRFTYIDYYSKSGDTYQGIISKLNISNEEKNKILKTLLKEKSLNILRINQKFSFKIDNLFNRQVVEFKIQTDKKNEILFSKLSNKNEFASTKIKKNFTKKLVYKETIITNSLYNSAINLNIKPNIIVEFARLYGFQIDFQRDVWKNDSFQIIYEEFVNDDNKIVDTGEIIFASLNLQNVNYQLYKYEYDKNKIDYFDENGKSVKKTLMKTPINGARLSSSYGKRKHQS